MTHLTVRASNHLIDRVEKKARALRMETGEELNRSDVIKMALESFTEAPRGKRKKQDQEPLGEIFLDLVNALEIERTVRKMTDEELRAAIWDHLDGAELTERQRAGIDLMTSVLEGLSHA